MEFFRKLYSEINTQVPEQTTVFLQGFLFSNTDEKTHLCVCFFVQLFIQ